MRRTLLLASAAALIASPALAQPTPAQTPPAAVAAPGGAPSAAVQGMQVSTTDFIRRAQMSGRFEIASGRLAQERAASAAVKTFAANMVQDHTGASQQLMDLTQRLGSAVMSQADQGQRVPGAGHAATGHDSRAGAGATPGAVQSGSATPGAAQSGSGQAAQRQAGATPPGMTTAQGGLQARGMDPEHEQIMQRLTQAQGAEFDRLYMQAQVEAHQKAVDLFTAYSQRGDQAELKQWAAKTLPTLQNHLQQAQQIQRAL
jgi:predicted outer membrane protein